MKIKNKKYSKDFLFVTICNHYFYSESLSESLSEFRH